MVTFCGSATCGTRSPNRDVADTADDGACEAFSLLVPDFLLEQPTRPATTMAAPPDAYYQSTQHRNFPPEDDRDGHPSVNWTHQSALLARVLAFSASWLMTTPYFDVEAQLPGCPKAQRRHPHPASGDPHPAFIAVGTKASVKAGAA